MRILFLGDIMGKTGRNAVMKALPNLRQNLELDMVIVNGENAAHGFGITPTIATELLDCGVDVITGGNHSMDRGEVLTFMEQEPRLLRPQNLLGNPAGKGNYCAQLENGASVLVISVMARLFMELSYDPFAAIEALLPQGKPVESGLDAVIVDVHGEANSEKYIMGHYCDGRASLVIGTHTHVPTADHQILPGGTAFQCDAGMCGDYDSSIGMAKEAAIDRALGTYPRPRLSPAEGPATLCGVVVETDAQTGLAKRIDPIRLGGRLSQIMPDFSVLQENKS